MHSFYGCFSVRYAQKRRGMHLACKRGFLRSLIAVMRFRDIFSPDGITDNE
jgi:hypothetical protein